MFLDSWKEYISIRKTKKWTTQGQNKKTQWYGIYQKDIIIKRGKN